MSASDPDTKMKRVSRGVKAYTECWHSAFASRTAFFCYTALHIASRNRNCFATLRSHATNCIVIAPDTTGHTPLRNLTSTPHTTCLAVSTHCLHTFWMQHMHIATYPNKTPQSAVLYTNTHKHCWAYLQFEQRIFHIRKCPDKKIQTKNIQAD